MRDTITLLTTLGGIPLAKTWRADGTIQGYGRLQGDGTTVGAKRYTLETQPVDGINDVHRVLGDISGYRDCCAIRGEYNGHPLEDGKFVLRRKAFFADVPRHWLMFDVDGYTPTFADPLTDPEAAFDDWIHAALPECFRGVTYAWQLSGSAGHPSKPGEQLRGHVWFWLDRPYDSDTLEAWVTAEGRETLIDRSVLDSVQVHYTADPIMADGVIDTVPTRLGLVPGFLADSVDLVIDEAAIAEAKLRLGRGGEGHDGRFVDPRQKKGPIGAFCRAFSVADVLAADWFEQAGEFEAVTDTRWTWHGGNGAREGVRIDETGFVNTHNSAPFDTFRRRLNAFDVLRVYQFGELDEAIPTEDRWTIEVEPHSAPSYKAAVKFIRDLPEVQAELDDELESRELEPMSPAIDTAIDTATQATPEVKDPSDKWAAEMFDKLEMCLRIAGADKSEISAILLRKHVLAAWRGVFFNNKSSRLHMINRDGVMVDFRQQDWHQMIIATFGHLWDWDGLTAAASRIHPDNAGEQATWRSNHRVELWDIFERYVMLYRQRQAIAWEVDMFAKSDSMMMGPDNVSVTLRHIPYKVAGLPAFVTPDVQAEILSEFKRHFPFDELLQLVLAARFAADRRKAFLWLRMGASAGKGFLFQGVLGRDGLGIVAQISAKEIERAFEGNPLGIDASMVYRSHILWIDEFKAAKAEIKQLNNTILITPKNQLRSEVPVYLKVFTSAEGVDSMAGSEGVEAQFAERFSYLERLDGVRLDDLPLFRKHGRMIYRDVLRNHAAEVLNEGIERMRAMGKHDASRVADEWLDLWHVDHGIGNSHASLEDNLDDYADEIKALVREWALGQVGEASTHLQMLPTQIKAALSSSVITVVGSTSKRKSEAGEVELLAMVKRPVALVKAWVRTAIDQSQQVLVGHKATQIASIIGQGDPNRKVRVYRARAGTSEEINARGVLVAIKSEAEMAQERSEFNGVVPIPSRNVADVPEAVKT